MHPRQSALLRQELIDTHSELSSNMEKFETLYNNEATADHTLRVEFADLSASVKQLLALLRFAPLSFAGANREAIAVDLLAYLELKPVRKAEWYDFFGELKKLVFIMLTESEHLFMVDEGRDVTGPRHSMYVGGVDRVSEGDTEMDFDIPEASMQDQVREEIDFIVEALTKKIHKDQVS